MEDHRASAAASAPPVHYEGRWQDFLGLQIVNVLLTIVTLGIYRFWAKTRYRRYLWSSTWLGDDPLDYRGTGVELLVGALLAVLLVAVPFGVLSLLLPLLFGESSAATVVTQLLLFVGFAYLIGVGIYRSWRYLLSRTAWRGIRGGMTSGGWRFGLTNLKLIAVQTLSLGFATPWVGVRRWNALVRDMEFGSLPLHADARARAIYPRFLLAWGATILISIAVFAIIGFGSVLTLAQMSPDAPPSPGVLFAAIASIYGGIFLIAFLGSLLFAQYHAAFLREVYGATIVGDSLRLRFDAGARDVLLYYLGNFALIVLTLGVGILLLPHRHWGFHARRIRIDGAWDEERLLQTSLVGPRQGEGIADAFDLAPF